MGVVGKLLLVTGAGASRRLGRSDEGMSLMPGWANELCAALDEEEPGLAKACKLSPGMATKDFEANVGMLLKWAEVRHLEERYSGLLDKRLGTKTPPTNALKRLRATAGERIEVFRHVLNTTLYRLFGQSEVDVAKSAAAYQRLLAAVDGPDVIVATTNYDRAAETGLRKLGYEVSTGFRPEFELPPVFDPQGMVENRGSGVPVIHLHGAVGWYREPDGTVRDHAGGAQFHDSLGSPVVLYPGPDKDIDDARVSLLWLEFDAARDWADAVLVIGHSLHDEALVEKLNDTAKDKKVVVTFHDEDEKARMAKEVPRATLTQIDFGPEFDGDLGPLISD